MGKRVFLITLVCVAFGMQAMFAQEEFSWQLALVKDGVGLPFEEGVTVKDGEVFSLELSTEKDCYVYLVVEQASGSLTTLLSQQVKAGELMKKPCRLGPPSGQEKFYVITSLTEQKNLQTAIDSHKKEQTDRTTRVLKNRLFAINSRPGSVGGGGSLAGSFAGSLRGGEEIQGIVYSYSGASVYSKTILVSH